MPWHLLAIGVTAVTVLSGFDWWYFVHTRAIPGAVYLPAALLGGVLPIIVPVVLLIVGYRRRHEATKRLGLAIGQAALVALIVSSAYKAVTGRVEPALDGPLIDNSHAFNFGFLRYGVFWGWPSGHTMTAFAMAVTVVVLLRQYVALRVGVLAYALYIGAAVSISIHWFADFFAGAVIGAVIGVVTGGIWSVRPPVEGAVDRARDVESSSCVR